MSGLPFNNTGITPNNTPAKPASAGDIVDLFAEEDKGEKKPEKPAKEDKDADEDESKDKKKSEEKPVKRGKEDESDDDTEEDDEDEEEEDDDIEFQGDDEETDEEKLDLKAEDEEIKIDAPPRKKEITKEFPDFFKKFPWMEKMMFRDKQYTELFGSFNDARDVKGRAEILDNFEQDLMKGDTIEVLKQVKDNAPESFNKLVDNYLANLYKVDADSYHHVVNNIAKAIIREMAKDNDLKDAAKALNKFMFNSETYEPPQPKAKEAPEDDELKKEREAFTRERYTTARNDLQSRVDNVLRATISEYIDPKSEMTDYVKKNAIKDALSNLHDLVGNDKEFSKNLVKLWENAFKEKFSTNSLDAIRRSYLGKSKRLLSGVIKSARNTALKDAQPRKVKDKDDNEESSDKTSRRREPIRSGAPRHESGNRVEKGKMQKGESVLEFFSRD
jgi:hypothetical protein